MQTFVEYNSLDGFCEAVASSHYGPNVDNTLRIAQVVKRSGTLPIIAVTAEATYLRVAGQPDVGQVLQIHRYRSKVGEVMTGMPWSEEMAKRIDDIATRLRETASWNDMAILDGSGYSGDGPESSKR